MHYKTTLTALAAALLLAVGCEQTSLAESDTASPAPAPAPVTKSLDEVRNEALVTVNGEPITGEMFGIYVQEKMQKQPGLKNNPQLQNQAINELINIDLLAQAAVKQGLDKDPAVVTALALHRNELLSRLALQAFAKNNPPSEEGLRKTYEERYKDAGAEYKARHILVKTEDEAKKLIEELNEGADFAELAKQHSTGPTGKNGGDLGWFGSGQMVKPFSDATAALEPGSYTAEPVKTQFGWHVIKLEEKRDSKPPEFEAVKAELATSAQRNAMSTYVGQLRQQAKIDINEKLTKKPTKE